MELLGQTWPVRAAKETVNALGGMVYHTGEAIAGRADPMDVRPAVDFALAASGGGIAGAPARAGEAVLGSGPVRSTKMADVMGHELPLNPDGTVTLYHATAPDRAQQILSSRMLRSEAEPSVYFSTANQGTGYGDTVVAVDVNPKLLQLDDEFPGGRVDFRIDRPQMAIKNPRLWGGK
jgi:hypothetical protein